MHNTAKASMAKQLYLLELEHKHYLKVVGLVKKYLKSGVDEGVISDLISTIGEYEKAKYERESSMYR